VCVPRRAIICGQPRLRSTASQQCWTSFPAPVNTRGSFAQNCESRTKQTSRRVSNHSGLIHFKQEGASRSPSNPDLQHKRPIFVRPRPGIQCLLPVVIVAVVMTGVNHRSEAELGAMIPREKPPRQLALPHHGRQHESRRSQSVPPPLHRLIERPRILGDEFVRRLS